MPPANVVLVLSKPVVNTVPVPSTKLPPVEPPPAIEPMLKLLLSCNIAPLTLLKVTADLSPKALACEVMTLPPVMAVLPVVGKTNFDPLKDFVPISNVGSNPFVMGVHKSVPANNLSEFVAYMRKNPGKFNYASGGSASVSHLSAALFVKRAELDMTHISYKGGAPAVTDLLGGNVQMYFGNFSELYPHVSGGNIRIIGVSSDKRAAQLPQVATIAESGFPGFRTVTWNGLMAPAGTPPAVVARLAEAVKDALASDGTQSKFQQMGVDAIGSSPREFAETLRADMAIWSEAAKAAQLKME